MSITGTHKLPNHSITTRFDHTLQKLQPLDHKIYDAMWKINNDPEAPRPAFRTETLSLLPRTADRPPNPPCDDDSYRHSIKRLRDAGLIRTELLSTEAGHVALGSLYDRQATTPTLRGFTPSSCRNIPLLVSTMSALRDKVEAVHNPRFKFNCEGLYELIPESYRVKGASEKRLPRMSFEHNRYANIAVYSGEANTVVVEVSSSTHPFPRGTLLGLRDILERVRHGLLLQHPQLLATLPLVEEWEVIMFEVNTDARVPPLAGESFHISYRDFQDVQHTLYVKDSSTGLVRDEYKKMPRKPYSEVMGDEARWLVRRRHDTGLEEYVEGVLAGTV